MSKAKMLFIQVLGIWFILLFLAIMNGGIREKFIMPHIGEYPAHVASTIILALLIFIVASIFIRAKGITNTSTLFLIGISWVILTMAFEFLFFHYVSGVPWLKLIADYDIFKGRLFILVHMSSLFSPFIASKLFINKQGAT